MGWLALLQVVIAAGRGLVAAIDSKLSPAYSELADDANAGLAKLQEVHDKAVSLQGLEDLRTKKVW